MGLRLRSRCRGLSRGIAREETESRMQSPVAASSCARRTGSSRPDEVDRRRFNGRGE